MCCFLCEVVAVLVCLLCVVGVLLCVVFCVRWGLFLCVCGVLLCVLVCCFQSRSGCRPANPGGVQINTQKMSEFGRKLKKQQSNDLEKEIFSRSFQLPLCDCNTI